MCQYTAHEVVYFKLADILLICLVAFALPADSNKHDNSIGRPTIFYCIALRAQHTCILAFLRIAWPCTCQPRINNDLLHPVRMLPGQPWFCCRAFRPQARAKAKARGKAAAPAGASAERGIARTRAREQAPKRARGRVPRGLRLLALHVALGACFGASTTAVVNEKEKLLSSSVPQSGFTTSGINLGRRARS